MVNHSNSLSQNNFRWRGCAVCLAIYLFNWSMSGWLTCTPERAPQCLAMGVFSADLGSNYMHGRFRNEDLGTLHKSMGIRLWIRVTQQACASTTIYGLYLYIDDSELWVARVELCIWKSHFPFLAAAATTKVIIDHIAPEMHSSHPDHTHINWTTILSLDRSPADPN